MRLAVIVQRYGLEINGGAELHARYIAERLARHAEVEVLTTCARDYVTWRNEYPAGVETIEGLRVRRFPVARERDPYDFGLRSRRVFEQPHSLADELGWLSSQGPTSPALLSYLVRHEEQYDYCLFFSYRYYHACHGIRAVASRALLVPTAERDPAIGLSVFGPTFRGVRGILYNSFEERALIQHVSGNRAVPGVVVGVGSEVPDEADAARFRARTGIAGPFALYVGRIDPNKGCADMFSHFRGYAAEGGTARSAPRGGRRACRSRTTRASVTSGSSPKRRSTTPSPPPDLLIMPSPYESLSMVTLEAWAMGRPVLVNGDCDVLRGQAVRSNAGLYYTSYAEFVEALRLLENDPGLRAGLGANGRRYFERHYTWPEIDRKYLDLLDRLQQGGSGGGRGAPWSRCRDGSDAAAGTCRRPPRWSSAHRGGRSRRRRAAMADSGPNARGAQAGVAGRQMPARHGSQPMRS